MGTTLAEMRQPQAPQLPAVRAGFFDAAGFELMQRVAKGFAQSTLVPKEYQGNIANCMIALNLAQRINADALMVMQNLYVVHGRPGWSAQFLIATFNQCGRFSALRYEFFGERGKDSWGCRAWATELSTGEKIVGSDVSISLARAEGWFDRNGTKWKTMPQQMLMYRAAAWMVRAYAPEIAMGLPTTEEIGDTFEAGRDERGAYQVTLESLDRTTGEIKPVDDGGADTSALLDYIAALDEKTAVEEISAYAEGLPESIRAESAFAKAVSKRIDAIKKAAKQ